MTDIKDGLKRLSHQIAGSYHEQGRGAYHLSYMFGDLYIESLCFNYNHYKMLYWFCTKVIQVKKYIKESFFVEEWGGHNCFSVLLTQSCVDCCVRFGVYIVMWVQEDRICIWGKIEFFVDLQNTDKNTQFESYFKSEVILIWFLREKRCKKNQYIIKKHKMASPAKCKNADTTFLHSHDDTVDWAFHLIFSFLLPVHTLFSVPHFNSLMWFSKNTNYKSGSSFWKQLMFKKSQQNHKVKIFNIPTNNFEPLWS